MPLLVSFDPLMVSASVLVAILASFTGLKLASGLRFLDVRQRKSQIVKSAIALGGGIWSMHFVGMLAVQLPVEKNYDALLTLGSVLIAILFTGMSVYLLHFGARTLSRIIWAGTLTGLGIVSMHYVGMGAIKGNCIVTFAPTGIVLSTSIALLSSIGAFALAYRKRTLLQLALGSGVLGITISGMHYSAMLFSKFMPVADIVEIATPVLSDGYLALIVAMAAFLICGFFLLTTFPLTEISASGNVTEPFIPTNTYNNVSDQMSDHRVQSQASAPDNVRLPYELNKTTYFLDEENIFSIKAEGHYSVLFDGTDNHFCPWPISKIENILAKRPFVRTHRSYLVNLRHASVSR
jgi:diguanylate cyclase